MEFFIGMSCGILIGVLLMALMIANERGTDMEELFKLLAVMFLGMLFGAALMKAYMEDND